MIDKKVLVPGGEETQDVHLANWHAFVLAYLEPIRQALRILRVPEQDVDDLAHGFLLKKEKNFLSKFHEVKARQSEAGKLILFRAYLYRSLQNHVLDEIRKEGARTPGDSDRAISFDPPETNPAQILDPDTIYALTVLHQSLQTLRHHAERSGKPHLWIFFEELLLADEFRGRRGKTRAELLVDYPGKDPSFIDNSLTTAKRAFRRIIQEVIPKGLREDATPDELFGEWLEILSHSNASQFDLLHLAYRVTPFLPPEATQVVSMTMLVKGESSGSHARLGIEPTIEPGVDEMGILVGLYLESPLTNLLDADQLSRYLLSSPFWQIPRKPNDSDSDQAEPPTVRPISLRTLVAPDLEEDRALGSVDLIGLLRRIKSLAKQLRYAEPNHSVPNSIARLFYTITCVLAIVRCQSKLHSIDDEALARNIRWFLAQDWLDDRIIPLLEAGLSTLNARK
jgi:DNA-directed RNA polymerase specialized sigma24 family protein